MDLMALNDFDLCFKEFAHKCFWERLEGGLIWSR